MVAVKRKAGVKSSTSVKPKRAAAKRTTRRAATKEVAKDLNGLPVLGANMCGIDFMEFETSDVVSFEFIDVSVMGEVTGTDYVEVIGIENGVVYRIDRSEFGRVESGKTGMIHSYARSKYGYSYLPF